MLGALALVTALAGPTNVDLVPTDDVWVYPRSSDNRDAYLRVWGSGGADVAGNSSDLDNFAYSYLRFDLSKVPAGKVTAAKLVLTHIPGPAYTLDIATKNPVVVRPISASFDEKTWDYAQVDTVFPAAGAKAMFGKGSPESLPAADKEFTVTVDLMKGPNSFDEYLQKGRSAKAVALGLTSTMDVSDGRMIYKFYSKDCDAASKRPVLKLTIGEQAGPNCGGAASRSG